MPRQFENQTYLNLKAATRDLVKLSGGPLRASSLTRGTQSRISEAMAPQEMERFAAIDQVADLEAETGQPIVTALLADMAGYNLVPRSGLVTSKSMHEHLAAIAKEGGELESKLAMALSDGSITAAERASIRVEAKDAIGKLNDLLASIDSISGSVRAVK